MKKFRIFYKLLFFSGILFLFFTSSLFILCIYKNSFKKYKQITAVSSILLKVLSWVLGFKITYREENTDISTIEYSKYFKNNKNYLIVSNHVSYLDIILLQSVLKNNCFISHYGVKDQSPLLYIISQMNYSYFIDRESFKNIRKELRDTAEILKQGVNLMLFPEGISTDGSKILPFHSLFFRSAFKAGKNILPLCIQYTHINDEPLNVENKELLFWHKESQMSFRQHLFSFLELKSVKASITFSSPLSLKDKNSRLLAEESRKSILNYFQPVV